MSSSRNDPCPCGSGKKYKHCHLNVDSSQGVQWRILPLAVAVIGVITGAVLLYTHGASIGGPVLAGAIILPIAWTAFTDPPPPKANTEHAAALKFGK